MTEKDIIILFVGFSLGFLVALFFYIRSSRDLRGKAADLRKQNTLILRAMEEKGDVKFNRDEHGKMISLDFVLKPRDSVMVTEVTKAVLKKTEK